MCTLHAIFQNMLPLYETNAILTLERRAVFCYVTGKGVQKLHPLYLRNGLEIFDAVFTNR